MTTIRISSSRWNYSRGGLVFAEPKARRVAGGRLAIDLTRSQALALGEAGARELVRDPAISIEILDEPGEDGEQIARHAAYRARQAAHQAVTPHTPIRPIPVAAPAAPPAVAPAVRPSGAARKAAPAKAAPKPNRKAKAK